MQLSAGNVARLLAAGALLWALFPHDYGYYVLLRWLVCAVAILTTIQMHQSGATGPALGFAGLAFVFNPIVPIYLSRSTWSLVDIGAALAFLWSAGTLKRNSPER